MNTRTDEELEKTENAPSSPPENENGDIPPISEKAHRLAKGSFGLSIGKVAGLVAIVFTSALCSRLLMPASSNKPAADAAPKTVITTQPEATPRAKISTDKPGESTAAPVAAAPQTAEEKPRGGFS